MSASTPEVVFSNDVRNMDDWARRTNIPLTSAEALGTTYARARRWLMSIKTQLVQQYGWRDVNPPDPRMLFTIEFTPRSNGIPRPAMRLQVPMDASTFFSPNRRVQWEMVFHSAVFPSMRHTVPPVADLLHVLQCLLTGLLVLVMEERVPGEGLYRTIRALPPIEWVTSHEQMLVDVFGSSHYRVLYRAAGDKRLSFKLEREP